MTVRRSRVWRGMVVGVTAALLLSSAGVVSAQAGDTYRKPVVDDPLVRHPADKGVLDIQIEGDEGDWGVRAVAKVYDRAVPGIRIFVKGTCAQRPHAQCITVEQYEETAEESTRGAWWGYQQTPGPGRRLVALNTHYGLSPYVACHEFGHALGLAHHTRKVGCIGTGVGATGNFDEYLPSRADLAALRRAYPLCGRASGGCLSGLHSWDSRSLISAVVP